MGTSGGLGGLGSANGPGDGGAAGESSNNSCPWDCEPVPDGNVGINDFLALLAQWNTFDSCDFGEAPPGIGVEDFLSLLANWGLCP